MVFKKRIAFSALFLAVTIGAGGIAAAASFKDVPETHWAYEAIDNITEKGLMMGDISGNFGPNDFISKFDISVILAKAAGFKHTNVTQEEQALYDKAYANHKDYINKLVEQSEIWNTSVSMEIAYLLEKGILIESDLNQFVSGQYRRALSKEEACVFLVRLLGKTEDARKLNITEDMLFKDDADITMDYRPYVYYLRSVGVITGDSTGASNFNPGTGATKAAFAVMLNKTIALMSSETPAPAPTETVEYQSVQGTIAIIYYQASALNITSDNSAFNNKIISIAESAVIKINGNESSVSDLSSGMTFSGVIKDGKFVSITAQALPAATTPPPETSPDTSQSTQTTQTTLEGIVASSSAGASGNTIEIELKLLNPRGVMYTEKRTYTLSADCVIYKNDVKTEFAQIVNGDIVTLTVIGNTAHSVKLEDKIRKFSGVVAEKLSADGVNITGIAIKDSAGRIYELILNADSSIVRDSLRLSTGAGLRIGDVVDVLAEYYVVTDLYAISTKSTLDVQITEINISAKGSSITTLSNDGEIIFPVIPDFVDIYSLRVGSKVRLRLDSMEVETVMLLQGAETTFITGYIHSLDLQSVTVIDTAYATKTLTYDSNTIIIDSTTGERAPMSALKSGMRLYVNYTAAYAKAITILNY